MTTRKEYITANAGEIRYNTRGHLLVLGCNYHTTWQSHKQMRFVLDDIENDKASLITRTSHKRFTTDVNDLIFIATAHNTRKAKDLLGSVRFVPINNPGERETLQNEAEQASMETGEHLEQT